MRHARAVKLLVSGTVRGSIVLLTDSSLMTVMRQYTIAQSRDYKQLQNNTGKVCCLTPFNAHRLSLV